LNLGAKYQQLSEELEQRNMRTLDALWEVEDKLENARQENDMLLQISKGRITVM
jgi:hypothetical protein